MDDQSTNRAGGTIIRTCLAIFALVIATALEFLCAYAWFTLFQEHGAADAPTVIRNHWQALLARSEILLLPAAIFGIAGVHWLKST